jgi:hypothetical protein
MWTQTSRAGEFQRLQQVSTIRERIGTKCDLTSIKVGNKETRRAVLEAVCVCMCVCVCVLMWICVCVCFCVCLNVYKHEPTRTA